MLTLTNPQLNAKNKFRLVLWEVLKGIMRSVGQHRNMTYNIKVQGKLVHQDIAPSRLNLSTV